MERIDTKRLLTRRELFKTMWAFSVLLLVPESVSCAKEPEKVSDLVGVATASSKYFTAKETNWSSQYFLVLQTEMGIKSFQVEDGYYHNNRREVVRVYKEAIYAMITPGTRIRVVSIPEKDLNNPVINVSALNIQVLSKE